MYDSTFLDVQIVNGQTKILSQASLYVPDQETKDITSIVLRDYVYGNNILNRTRPEFNDRSVLQEVDVNQRAFNSYVPPRSEDPDESWRAQTVRPLTRNKLISIAAHVTSALIYPNVFAYDTDSNEQKDAAFVMKSLIEWVIENSNYEKTFIDAVISALVDPVAIVQSEFAEVMRKVKGMKEDGRYTQREIVDEVLSGFHMYVVPVKNFLISNIYEKDIQRQRFVIKNRFIDYHDAKALHGDHKNFQYVKPGYRAVFDTMSSTFYDVRDKDMMQWMVNEVTYYNRALDLEIIFCNGILVTDPDRPNPRIDKLYPFAKSGYEPINNGLFFYYKSCANKLGSDQDIVDTLYNMIIDGSFLTLMPPFAVYGSEEIGTSVMIPGTAISFKDPNSKLETISPKIDLRSGMETIQKVEESMSESSQSELLQGIDNNSSDRQTAREIMLLNSNAKTAMGLFGRMIGFLVEDLGKLIMGDIIQHLTVGEVSDINSGMKFKSFLLHDKMIDGKNVTQKIEFTDPTKFSDEQSEKDISFDVQKRQGGMYSKTKLYAAHPQKFRDLKYKIHVTADVMAQKNESLEKALNLELYDRAIQNPTVDLTMVTKDFLFGSYNDGDNDKYLKKDDGASQGAQGLAGIMGGLQQKGVNTNLVSQLTGGNSLGVAASS